MGPLRCFWTDFGLIVFSITASRDCSFMFWILLLVQGIVVFPLLHMYLEQSCELKYWESAFIAFSALFAISAFLPLLGVPLIHPIRGDIIAEGTVLRSAFIPSLACALVGSYMIVRRKACG